ncbi:MAG: PLP-dependent aminotransferase family protein [Candidatus Cloacimonadaceae bacterium]|jgi:2-aminoadipate transaminase|nr:PLP-dependent aminotransferase family protein [Candidatus Cloacimonadota bacterium]MDX9949052.1 PLP-dependent aminotransferase family protein [Candidatus Syntrophosphaera sp.]
MNYTNSFSRVTREMRSSLIRELVASTKNIEGLISFAGGFPSPLTFPEKQLSEIFREVVANEGRDVLQYGASEGDALLKKELIKWEGYDIDPDEMLITVGATNALYYYGRALTEPGDVILCEGPSFLGSLVAFDALEVDCKAIPFDENGIIMTELEKQVSELRAQGKRIKFFYIIPDFQNPGGISYSLERRHELIRFCIENEIPIVEDNPYSRLRYSGEPLPTFYRLAHEEFNRSTIVTEIQSFSKILGPGMRIASVKGDKALIERMVSWQQKVNITPDCVSQRVVARFLERGLMDPHIESIKKFYAPYLNKMLEELEKNMPSTVKWTKPEGGIFLWLTLPENINADELFKEAAKNKVSFIPGSKFYPPGQERYNTLRLNFSFATPEQIETGIKRLAELLS